MKQRNILWKGTGDYCTLENCMVTMGERVNTVSAIVLGVIDNVPFRVNYILHADAKWRTTSFEVSYQLHNNLHKVNYSIDPKGNWTNKGIQYPLYCECAAVDISVTPFTNTLAVKSLELKAGESKTITVLYIDVVEHQTSVQTQTYTRLNENTYRFETADKSFTADIIFDDEGLVVNYPQLFERVYCG
ncbi:hypothetical protein EOD41_07175 [Mucilaginibacter limnophilus]|uniref:Glycolipid-binding domain-containing protein n=1 Tax=Mucilaginibacter limnophilus TaxID=1932778 RepID=A0A437MVP5_9SPHI|nr:putative glycolipid-binding domain-containing protein [Mucilaginibacter limnophilus]RVU01734.1 hypothetical protein EOD41_07175 [Mucilaginibacter limnophilus]